MRLVRIPMHPRMSHVSEAVRTPGKRGIETPACRVFPSGFGLEASRQPSVRRQPIRKGDLSYGVIVLLGEGERQRGAPPRQEGPLGLGGMLKQRVQRSIPRAI